MLGPALLAAKEKSPTTYTIPLPPKPDYSALHWLTGEWKGRTTGNGPQGEVHLLVSYDLDKRFMIFREAISLAATNAAPATSESWMGILSSSRSDLSFVLRVFSSTGFITRFRVTVDGAEIHFTPEGGEQPPAEWLFRRVVTRLSDAELSETVQAAPPSKSFFDYYSARLTRVSSGKKASPASGPANSKKD